MANIKVKKVPSSKSDKQTKREVYAHICFYYPQYKLKEVEKLPARDIQLLYKTSRKIEASRMYNLVQIISAPHTKKGEGIKKLSSYYEKVMKNG